MNAEASCRTLYVACTLGPWAISYRFCSLAKWRSRILGKEHEFGLPCLHSLCQAHTAATQATSELLSSCPAMKCPCLQDYAAGLQKYGKMVMKRNVFHFPSGSIHAYTHKCVWACTHTYISLSLHMEGINRVRISIWIYTVWVCNHSHYLFLSLGRHLAEEVKLLWLLKWNNIKIF